MPVQPWNERKSTSFLRYWRERATACYLDAVSDTHRDRKGERTKGNLACISMQRSVLLCIEKELRRRGEA